MMAYLFSVTQAARNAAWSLGYRNVKELSGPMEF
jgi:hypothetical protein